MIANYRLNANEITTNFLESIQTNYRNREIEITIYEVEDETDYLLKSSANSRRLLRGIEEVQSGVPLQTMSLEQLNQMV
jgi:antitoxin YefM